MKQKSKGSRFKKRRNKTQKTPPNTARQTRKPHTAHFSSLGNQRRPRFSFQSCLCWESEKVQGQIFEECDISTHFSYTHAKHAVNTAKIHINGSLSYESAVHLCAYRVFYLLPGNKRIKSLNEQVNRHTKQTQPSKTGFFLLRNTNLRPR